MYNVLSRQGTERAQTEVIGLVLLAGMVLVGVAILVGAGWYLLDGLKQHAQDEQTESTLDVVNDHISDVAASRESKNLPTEALENGAMTVEENSTTIELAPGHGECGNSYSFRLNALTYDEEDSTWVLEGGGQWEYTVDGAAQVRKQPGLGYENQQLSIDLVTFNESDVRDGDTVARHSGEPVVDQANLTEVIRCPGGTERRNAVWLNVTSEYVDAWDQHLSTTVTGDNVTYYGPDHARTDDDEINVLIDKLVRQRQATFGFSGGRGRTSRLVTFQSGLNVTPTVQNTGGTNGSTDVTLSINPEWTRTTGDLDSGEQQTVTFDLDRNDLSQIDGVDKTKKFRNVSQYGEYEYTLTTGNATATSGFFLSHRKPFYRLENVTHEKGATEENVTVTAEFTNITARSYDPELEFELEGQGESWDLSEEIETEAWSDSTFTIEINRSRLSAGTYNYTVEFPENHAATCNHNPEACSVTRQLTVSGVNASSNVSTVRVGESTNVSVKVLGTEISFEDSGSLRDSYGIGGTAFVVPDEHLRIENGSYADGTMTRNVGSGNYSFDVALPGPSSEDTEPKKNPNGGWVDPDGSRPQAECSWWFCYWKWQPDELQWSDSGGYDLEWKSGSEYTWQGRGRPKLADVDGVKSWGPVTASATVGDEQVRFSPEGTHAVSDPHQGTPERHNLNTFGTQETVWEYNSTIEEGAVSIEATYWACDQWGFAGTDTPESSNELYYHVECVDFDEDQYVQASTDNAGGSGADGFMMTRDRSRNQLPDIEKGYPRQRSIAEVFDDGTDDIELQGDELTLGDSDFAFMMETTETHDSIQSTYPRYADWWSDVDTSNRTAMNLAAWDIAQNERSSSQGDPNFNDVIGLVQIDRGTSAAPRNPLWNASIDGETREITSNYDVNDEENADSNTDGVDVRVDEIVIE